jgi:hypothetical protein
MMTTPAHCHRSERSRAIRGPALGGITLPGVHAGSVTTHGSTRRVLRPSWFLLLTVFPCFAYLFIGQTARAAEYQVEVRGIDATWKPTGIVVQQSQQFSVSATGCIAYSVNCSLAPSSCIWTNPNGRCCSTGGNNAGGFGTNFVCLTAASGSLVGRIGTGQCFQLGTSVTLLAPNAGQLFLIYNDTTDGFSNNCGSFNVSVTVPSPQTVSGNVSFALAPGGGMSGATVQLLPNGPVATTGTCGDFSMSSVPPGTYWAVPVDSATFDHDDWMWTPDSVEVVVSGAAVTDVDFAAEARGNVVASVVGEVPTTVIAGQPFTLTFQLENFSSSPHYSPAYLDVSFPNEAEVSLIDITPSTLPGASWTSEPTLVPPGEDVWHAPNPDHCFYPLPADYSLVTASRTGMHGEEPEETTFAVTMKAMQTGTLHVHYRGSLGDKRDPVSGSIDEQQGYFVKELDIPILHSFPTAPPDQIRGQPPTIYAGGAYTVEAQYHEADVPQPLRYCELRLDSQAATPIRLRWDSQTDKTTVEEGAQFVGYREAQKTPLPDGVLLRWTFVLRNALAGPSLWGETNSGISFAAHAIDSACQESPWLPDASSSAFHRQRTGVTVLAHGYSLTGDNFTDAVRYWNDGQFIVSLLRAYGGGRVFVYKHDSGFFVEDTRGMFQGTDIYNADGQLVLIHDWLITSNIDHSGQAEAASEALFAGLTRALVTSDQTMIEPIVNPESGTRLPLQFIGHSRGAVVCSETIQRLATYGIPVCYSTTLDPHDYAEQGVPFDETFHDPAVQVWTGVRRADNFWQESSNDLIPSGRHLEHLSTEGGGDYYLNQDLTSLTGFGNYSQTYPHSHGRVKNWYWGTIEPLSPENEIATSSAGTWYRDGVGYDVGFRQWFALGGFDADPLGTSEVTRIDPVTMGGLKHFLGPGEPDEDDDDASPHFFNGDFDLADVRDPNGEGGMAGWSYDGGTFGGAITQGQMKLLINENDPTMTIEARHNRVYVPAGAATLSFDLRTEYVRDGDSMTLVADDGSGPHELWSVEFSGEPINTRVPVSLCHVRGSVATLAWKLSRGGWWTTGVLLDAIEFDVTPPAGNAPPCIVLEEPLAGTTAVEQGMAVRVAWWDCDPDNNAMITCFRANGCDGGGQVAIGFAQENPQGTWACYPVSEGDCFEWDTAGVPPGTYRIRAMISDGVNDPEWACSPGVVEIREQSGVNEAGNLPAELSVSLVTPNPSMGRISLVIGLPTAAWVDATLVGVSGRVICTLHRGMLAAGHRTVAGSIPDLCGGSISSGVYFIRVQVGEERFIRRMLYLR